MPRSGCITIPRRLSYELEDALQPPTPLNGSSSQPPSGDCPREYDSWPGDSFFLLPDSVLAMDANAFRADLRAIDPVLSASLPEWPLEPPKKIQPVTVVKTDHPPPSSHCKIRATSSRDHQRSFTLLDNHEGLTVRSVGRGTVLIGK